MNHELDELKRELARMRQQVADLRSLLDARTETAAPTMRARICCPACGCRTIAHAPQILDRGDNDTRSKMALYKPSWWSGKTAGELEAYVCTRCGLLEWYVRDPASLEPHRKYLRFIDGDAQVAGSGPYR